MEPLPLLSSEDPSSLILAVPDIKGSDLYNPNDIEQLIYHGFSLGDETIQMPYLATYIHPWPKDFLPRVKKPQYYNDKEWRGIVLNYSDIKSPEEVVDFFTTHHEQLLSTI